MLLFRITGEHDSVSELLLALHQVSCRVLAAMPECVVRFLLLIIGFSRHPSEGSTTESELLYSTIMVPRHHMLPVFQPLLHAWVYSVQLGAVPRTTSSVDRRLDVNLIFHPLLSIL
ncbi:unnamed protein product [Dicrocoelium dendriticum]|nr:unnamed protein product [Dicrocoelium dendriticum]